MTQKRAGTTCIAVTEEPGPLATLLGERYGVAFLLPSTDPEALDNFDSLWSAARNLLTVHSRKVNRGFRDITAALFDAQPNMIHSLGILNFYMDLYEAKMGKLPKTVLELGFGDSPVGSMLACNMWGAEYAGVTAVREVDPELREVEREVLAKLNLASFIEKAERRVARDYRLGEGGKFPLRRKKYDLIFAHVVLEHVENMQGFLGEVRRLLKKGGQFIAYTDLSGHGISGDPHPLHFLTMTQEEWEAAQVGYLDHHGYLPCRRERAPWYVAQVKQAGMQVEFEVRNRTELPENSQVTGEDADVTELITYGSV